MRGEIQNGNEGGRGLARVVGGSRICGERAVGREVNGLLLTRRIVVGRREASGLRDALSYTGRAVGRFGGAHEIQVGEISANYSLHINDGVFCWRGSLRVCER
jgi:hypothetical protein